MRKNNGNKDTANGDEHDAGMFFVVSTSKNSAESACHGLRVEDSVRSESAIRFFENRIVREWLSTDEAAHFLSVSANALRIMVHRDQIRAYKFGRRLRFKVRDCQALFQKRGAR